MHAGCHYYVLRTHSNGSLSPQVAKSGLTSEERTSYTCKLSNDLLIFELLAKMAAHNHDGRKMAVTVVKQYHESMGVPSRTQ